MHCVGSDTAGCTDALHTARAPLKALHRPHSTHRGTVTPYTLLVRRARSLLQALLRCICTWWTCMLRRYPEPTLCFRCKPLPKQQSFPLAMIPMRSPRMSASSMLWVVSTTAHCCFTAAIRSHRWRREIGSIPMQQRKGVCNLTPAHCVFVEAIRSHRCQRRI